VDSSERRVRAGVVSLSDVAARRGLEERGRALVARDLCRGGFSCGELEEVAGVGWLAEMAVEPPLLKGVVGERSDGPVIVREGVRGDVEAVHARVEHRWPEINLRGRERESGVLTGVGVHVGGAESKERKERESEHGFGENGARGVTSRGTLLASGEKREEREGWSEGLPSPRRFPFLSLLHWPSVGSGQLHREQARGMVRPKRKVDHPPRRIDPGPQQ
jgi:hypothetical protein